MKLENIIYCGDNLTWLKKYPDDWTQDKLDRGGFFDIIQDFIDLWNKLNKKGYRWGDDPTIYRIKFEYLGESLNEK